MIREVINFTHTLQNDNPDIMQWKDKPSIGLHIFIDVNEFGEWSNSELVKGKDYEYYDGKNDELKLWQESIRYQAASNYITMNKVQKFDALQKIHSCSPFAIAFNLKFNDIDKKKYGIKKKPNNVEKKINDELVRKTKCHIILERLSDYQKKSQNIYFGTTEPKEKVISTCFFNVIPLIIERLDQINEYAQLSDEDYVRIYLRSLDIEKQEKFYELYYKENLFNVDKYTINDTVEDLGIAGFMTSFPDKKPFLRHYTSSFIKGVNMRITKDEALTLDNFMKLFKRGCFPCPLPIFVDKNEFYKGDIISLLRQNDVNLSYSEILKKVYDKNVNTVLSNYYLLNMVQTKDGPIVKDFDYVPLFRYKIDCIIKNFTNLGDTVDYHVNNIFALEQDLNYFFVKYQKNTKQGVGFLIRNYFTDKLESQKGYEVRNEIQVIMYKYRNAIYDFIYKSKTSALTCQILDDIAINSILADINTDMFNNNNHLRYSSIRKKINVWFSLYNSKLFINNKKRYDMSTLVEKHLKMMQDFSLEKGQLENNTDYGFAVGQVIYYILDKSKSIDKSYSRLVPFLQKTSREELTKAILHIFEMYAHENFSNKFKYVFGLIMEYDKDVSIKEIMPNVMGGFFLPNKLFSDNNN